MGVVISIGLITSGIACAKACQSKGKVSGNP